MASANRGSRRRALCQERQRRRQEQETRKGLKGATCRYYKLIRAGAGQELHGTEGYAFWPFLVVDFFAQASCRMLGYGYFGPRA